ncbi:MAG: lecithin retinol acyltransferase family protein [Burkholderiaceae bacterium]
MMEDLPLGAHLTSPRWGYVHHGLYAGAGRVIHYAGFNQVFRSGRVEEVPLERFTLGRAVQVKAWVAPKFSGEAALARAQARLGENHYSFWANNCEQFAQWCISGTSRSEQVDSWTAWLRVALDRFGPVLATRGRLTDGRAIKAAVSALLSRPSPSNTAAARNCLADSAA